MNENKKDAFILLPLLAALIVYAAGRRDWILPSVLGASLLGSAWIPGIKRFSKIWVIIVFSIIGLAFSYWYAGFGAGSGISLLFLESRTLKAISIFCALSLVYMRLMRPAENRDSRLLMAAFALVTLSGNETGRPLYVPFAGIFFAMLMIYFGIKQRRMYAGMGRGGESFGERVRKIAPVILYLIVAMITFAGLLGITKRAEGIVAFIGRMVVDVEVGRPGMKFDNSMKLGNLSRFEISDEPVLMVTGKGPVAEYLRCKVFDIYDKREWKESQATTAKEPFAHRDPLPGGEARYIINIENQPSWNYRLEVAANMGDVLPAPYDTSAARSPEPLSYNPGTGILSVNSKESPYEYSVEGSADGRSSVLSESEIAELTQIPESVKSALLEKAAELVGAGATDEEAALKIRKFFAGFEYSLEEYHEIGKDPFVDFILNRRSGYCQHFSSGAVLLLRTIGIPSRVVTGFIIREPLSDKENSWIVRRRDSHAWCEYYDRQKKRWTLLEATPVASMNDALGINKKSYLSKALDSLAFKIKMLAVALRGFNFAAWLKKLNPTVALPFVLPIAAALLALMMYRRLRGFIYSISKGILNWKRRGKKGKADSISMLSNEYSLFMARLEKMNIHIADSDTGEEILAKVVEFGPALKVTADKCNQFIQLFNKTRFRSASDVEVGGIINQLAHIRTNMDSTETDKLDQ